MTPDALPTEQLLAAALRGEAESHADAIDGLGAAAAIVEAAVYHGVAGLLIEQGAVTRTWPRQIVEPLAEQARAQAMWELRHRQVLATLLAAMHQNGLRPLLMKGTAVAYDLYPNPAVRARGDTDILVTRDDAPKAKAVMAELGYAKAIFAGVNEEFALQQGWILAIANGSPHSIDLHWQVMNAPSLGDLLTFAECDAASRPLPRLSPEARTMDRVHLLIHTCLHRAMHCNTPYKVAGRAYYDSGRLIWSYDLHLLAEALDDDQWSRFCDLAIEGGVARVCLDGLLAARASLGTAVPDRVADKLERARSADRNSLYFVRSRAVARAWQDFRAFPGLRRKLRYAAARILPDPRFLRGKYPDMANASLPLLYARRLAGLMRMRRGNADAG